MWKFTLAGAVRWSMNATSIHSYTSWWRQPQNKGIVHLKIICLSSFTHPHLVPNLYDFLSAVEHQKIFWRTKNVFIHTMKVICIPQKKREDLQVWFNMRLSKWKRKINFWVNYLFNAGFLSTFNRCFSANQRNEMEQHKHASLQCE